MTDTCKKTETETLATTKILIIEDNDNDAVMVKALLPAPRFEQTRETTARAGLARLRKSLPDIVLADLSLSDAGEKMLVRKIRSFAPVLPIIALTRTHDNHLALELIREGADDYIVKGDLNAAYLQRSIAFVQERRRLQARYNALTQDLTHQTERQKHLRESQRLLQEKFAATIKASGQLLYEWTPATDALVYCNLQAALGYRQPRGKLTLSHWIDLIHPEDAEGYRRAVAEAIVKCTAFRLEYRVRRLDGSYEYVEDRGYTIEKNGEVSQTVNFVTDISDRKILEEQLHQSQKLEALGQLAGGVAHDFNNLLSAIIGFSQLTLDLMPPEDKCHDFVKEVFEAGKRATALTRQLLAFSRHQTLDPVVLQPNPIIQDAYKMLSRLIGEHVNLKLELDSALYNITADPSQIEQIIMNLAINARDAMPNGGELVISTKNVSSDADILKRHPLARKGRYALITVSDTGTGMDTETQARIFEPFFTTKAPGCGTGLGLATVHGIVSQMKGSISAESTIGVGTTFEILLKRATDELTQTTDAIYKAIRGNGELILVAEDDPAVRNLLKIILTEAGYKVAPANDGVHALTLVVDGGLVPHLLICDYAMPRMTGPEFANALCQKDPSLPVIFLSGYSDVKLGDSCKSSVVEFMPKPFSPDHLVATVQRLLSTAERLRESPSPVVPRPRLST